MLNQPSQAMAQGNPATTAHSNSTPERLDRFMARANADYGATFCDQPRSGCDQCDRSKVGLRYA